MTDRPVIDVALVRRLVDEQFPEYRTLPVRPVEWDGWDNRTFRLGDELSVRLPSARGYLEQVAKEHAWLPRLAPRLPLPIPVPVAKGEPGAGYPFPWSVYRWLPGTPLALAADLDEVTLAEDLGHFLVALREVDAAGGPAPGTHNFFRGDPPGVYRDEALAAIDAGARDIDPRAARRIWDAAEDSRWDAPPVWFHGDAAPGNLLVADGRLSAVIDFGTSGVGDPACDLVPAWTMFDGSARRAFGDTIELDDATWARARGWALWKALITVRDDPDDAGSRRTLSRLAADPGV
ncbi:acetyltransferase [Leifsonia sp. Leaf336]|uniref:aminoglycoside phosphotransferase family protein n=1 Tax=Leifsonia sp. Leaf336 TaxID=1736341 RepID=UPI0006F4F52B|nr:aminoglycoside phosphotransferase family protein [Leifsonia sp. Leaf336]KQR54037.1 acetyltransferase [Leifsonia sp. Leaf336]